MSKMSQLDASYNESQVGVIVENITALVENYQAHCGLNPITRELFDCESITRIMCAQTDVRWDIANMDRFALMSRYLLEDIISGQRLELIQYELAIKDITHQCDRHGHGLKTTTDTINEICMIVEGAKL